MSTIAWLRDPVTGRAGETWNPIRARHKRTGKIGWYCEPVHAGCKHCYAGDQNERAARGGTGLPFKPGHRDDVEVFLDEKTLYAPLGWKAPRRIFPCSMTDLCGPWVKPGWFLRILEVIFQTPQHIYVVLTKRPDRLRSLMVQWGDLSGETWEPKLVRGPDETRKAHPSGRGQLFADYLDAMLESAGGKVPDGAAFPTFDWAGGMIGWPAYPLNLWAGPSCSTKADVHQFVPEVLRTPLRKRVVSLEPLLDEVDLTRVFDYANEHSIDALAGRRYMHPHDDEGSPEARLDLAIVGGLSGPDSTAIGPIRSIVRQCRTAGTPVFVKQLGTRCTMPRSDAEAAIAGGAKWLDTGFSGPDGASYVTVRFRDHKGENPSEWPSDLRVREWPGMRG